jgi:hypothetical protein
MKIEFSSFPYILTHMMEYIMSSCQVKEPETAMPRIVLMSRKNIGIKIQRIGFGWRLRLLQSWEHEISQYNAVTIISKLSQNAMAMLKI